MRIHTCSYSKFFVKLVSPVCLKKRPFRINALLLTACGTEHRHLVSVVGDLKGDGPDMVPTCYCSAASVSSGVWDCSAENKPDLK